MKILGSTKLDFDDVLIRPKSSAEASRKDIDLIRHFTKFPHASRTLKCVPIMAANMSCTGTFDMAKALCERRWITCLHKHYSLDDLVKFYDELPEEDYGLVWYSMGISIEDLDKLQALRGRVILPNICIDTANGYTDHFVEKVAMIRQMASSSIIMAGNVATSEMVDRIIRHGKADIVKVGVGGGSACTTRIVTGIGYPQLSACLECSDAAHGSQHGYICSDGGCRTSGDIAKAFGANSDFVMLGGLLSGTEENEGEWEYQHKCCNTAGDIYNVEADYEPSLFGEQVFTEKTKLRFFGMSSNTAQEQFNDGKKDYRASEGKAVWIDYKGPVENICKQIEGGLRSCCTYTGAKKIKDLGKCTTFITVNRTHNTFYKGSEEFHV